MRRNEARASSAAPILMLSSEAGGVEGESEDGIALNRALGGEDGTEFWVCEECGGDGMR